MLRQKKTKLVDLLVEMLSGSTIVVATDYRGLTVREITELRRDLREAGTRYRVVKNTLAQLAGEKAGKPGLSRILEGPTALALGYGDVTETARALTKYLQSGKRRLSIRGGLLGDRVLSPSEVMALSTLPSREVLVGKLMGVMQGPIFALVNVLSANLRGLLTVLKGRIEQLEGG